MQVHLFRHGQTDWNAERRLQGQSDSQLTDLGQQQARELGERIRHLQFDQVFCSSSLRTRQTAAQAFADFPGEIIYLDAFREIFLGPWEGRLYAEMEQEQPDAFRHFWQEPHLFNVEGAETFAQLQQRALNALFQIQAQGKGARIAIVSHGALIKALLCHFAQRPLSELWAPPSLPNCAHSIVTLDPSGGGTIIQIADQPPG